jgi:hypothetical protein
VRKAIVPVLLVLACTLPSRGWNGKGHEVVAYIAYQHLNANARAKIDSLLKLNPCYSEWTTQVAALPKESQSAAIFMLAATWPDEIKLNTYDCQPGHQFGPDGSRGGDVAPTGPAASQNIGYEDTHRHKYWHFVDTPFSTDNTEIHPAPHPNALDEIQTLAAALESNAPDELKSYDLVWIEHLIGDIHQPLHDTTRFTKSHPDGDAGGNLVIICEPPGCKSELHGYWDSILGPQDLTAALMLGSQLNKPAQPSGASDTDPATWVQEGFELAKTAVYQPPISDDEPDSAPGTPNKTYHDHAKIIAGAQVLLAGYRLAASLNRALGQ